MMDAHIPERGPVRSKAEARAAAESIARRMKVTAPVPVEEVAVRLGVQVIPAPPNDAGLFGAFVLREGRPFILYRSSDVPARKRFTIAHELGHFILHSHSGEDTALFRDDRSSKGTAPKEIQANAFAAALLMPEWLVRERQPSPIPNSDDHTVDELAEAFKVSSQAMGIRLASLGLYTPPLI